MERRGCLGICLSTLILLEINEFKNNFPIFLFRWEKKFQFQIQNKKKFTLFNSFCIEIGIQIMCVSQNFVSHWMFDVYYIEDCFYTIGVVKGTTI